MRVKLTELENRSGKIYLTINADKKTNNSNKQNIVSSFYSNWNHLFTTESLSFTEAEELTKIIKSNFDTKVNFNDHPYRTLSFIADVKKTSNFCKEQREKKLLKTIDDILNNNNTIEYVDKSINRNNEEINFIQEEIFEAKSRKTEGYKTESNQHNIYLLEKYLVNLRERNRKLTTAKAYFHPRNIIFLNNYEEFLKEKKYDFEIIKKYKKSIIDKLNDWKLSDFITYELEDFFEIELNKEEYIPINYEYIYQTLGSINESQKITAKKSPKKSIEILQTFLKYDPKIHMENLGNSRRDAILDIILNEVLFEYERIGKWKEYTLTNAIETSNVKQMMQWETGPIGSYIDIPDNLVKALEIKNSIDQYLLNNKRKRKIPENITEKIAEIESLTKDIADIEIIKDEKLKQKTLNIILKDHSLIQHIGLIPGNEIIEGNWAHLDTETPEFNTPEAEMSWISTIYEYNVVTQNADSQNTDSVNVATLKTVKNIDKITYTSRKVKQKIVNDFKIKQSENEKDLNEQQKLDMQEYPIDFINIFNGNYDLNELESISKKYDGTYGIGEYNRKHKQDVSISFFERFRIPGKLFIDTMHFYKLALNYLPNGKLTTGSGELGFKLDKMINYDQMRELEKIAKGNNEASPSTWNIIIDYFKEYHNKNLILEQLKHDPDLKFKASEIIAYYVSDDTNTLVSIKDSPKFKETLEIQNKIGSIALVDYSALMHSTNSIRNLEDKIFFDKFGCHLSSINKVTTKKVKQKEKARKYFKDIIKNHDTGYQGVCFDLIKAYVPIWPHFKQEIQKRIPIFNELIINNSYVNSRYLDNLVYSMLEDYYDYKLSKEYYQKKAIELNKNNRHNANREIIFDETDYKHLDLLDKIYEKIAEDIIEESKKEQPQFLNQKIEYNYTDDPMYNALLDLDKKIQKMNPKKEFNHPEEAYKRLINGMLTNHDVTKFLTDYDEFYSIEQFRYLINKKIKLGLKQSHIFFEKNNEPWKSKKLSLEDNLKLNIPALMVNNQFVYLKEPHPDAITLSDVPCCIIYDKKQETINTKNTQQTLFNYKKIKKEKRKNIERKCIERKFGYFTAPYKLQDIPTNIFTVFEMESIVKSLDHLFDGDVEKMWDNLCKTFNNIFEEKVPKDQLLKYIKSRDMYVGYEYNQRVLLKKDNYRFEKMYYGKKPFIVIHTPIDQYKPDYNMIRKEFLRKAMPILDAIFQFSVYDPKGRVEYFKLKK